MPASIRVGLLFGDRATRDGRNMLLSTVGNIDVVYQEEDGLRAIEKLTDAAVDVVLVDNRLRSLSGSQFIQKFLRRNLATGSTLPSFVLTGPFASVAMTLEAIRSGADDLVTEDEAADEIIQAVLKAAKPEKVVDIDDLRGVFHSAGLTSGSNTRWLLRLTELDDKEQAVIDGFSEGLEIPEIAESKGMTQRAVHSALDKLQARLQLATRAQLVLSLFEAGIIPD